jgi:hypothetical protein
MRYEELLALHQVLKNAFKTRRKSLSPGSFEIYQFIKERGGVPLKQKKTFWHECRIEWNKTHPGRGFKSPDSLRICYYRVANNINIPEPEPQEEHS